MLRKMATMMSILPKQQTGDMQVHYALTGSGISCSKCKKYHSKTISHTKNRDYSKTTYCVNFAKLEDEMYFCYFGCQEFDRLDKLKEHILTTH